MLTVRESADRLHSERRPTTKQEEMSRDLSLPSSLSDQSAASYIYMYRHETGFNRRANKRSVAADNTCTSSRIACALWRSSS